MSWVDTVEVKGTINKDREDNIKAPEFELEFKGIFDYDKSGVYEKFNYIISSEMHKVLLSFDSDNNAEVKILKNDGELEIYKLVKEKTIDTKSDDVFSFTKNKEEISSIKNETKLVSELIVPDGTKVFVMRNMEYVKSIFIPASVEKIDTKSLFINNLEKIVIDDNNPYYGSYDSNVIVDKRNMELIKAAKNGIIPDGVRMIGYNALAYNENDNIVIPNSVEVIGDGAFSNSLVKNIIFSNNLSTIKRNAFLGCKSLKDFVLPESLKVIEDKAFFECMSIKNIIIPDSCANIGLDAFENCFSLENITLPSNLKIKGKILHYGEGVEDPFGDNPVDREYRINGNMYNDGMYIASKTNPYYMLLKCECNNEIIEIHKDTKIISSDILKDILSEYSNVKKVIVPKAIETIIFEIESISNDQCIIEYEGTLEEWNNVNKIISPFSSKDITISIECSNWIDELKME